MPDSWMMKLSFSEHKGVTIRIHLLFSFLAHAILLTFILSLPLYRGSIHFKSFASYSVDLVKEEGEKARRPLSAYKVRKPGVVASDQKKDEKTVLEPMGVNVKESSEHLGEEKKVVSEGKAELKLKVEEVKIAKAVEEKKPLGLLKAKKVLKKEVLATKGKETEVVKKEEPKAKELEKKEVIVQESLPVEKPKVEKAKEVVKPTESPTLPEQSRIASLEPVKEKEQIPPEEVLKKETMYLEKEEKVAVKEKKVEHEIAIKKEEVPEKVAEAKKPSEVSDVGKVSKKEAPIGKGKKKKVAKAEGYKTKKAFMRGAKKIASAPSKGKPSMGGSETKKVGEGVSLPTSTLARTDTGLFTGTQSGTGAVPSAEEGIKGETLPAKGEGKPMAGLLTSEKHIMPSQGDSSIKKEEIKQQTMVEVKPEAKEEKKPALGIPVSDVLLARDIRIEVFFHSAEISGVITQLIKKTHPMDQKKYNPKKSKEIDGLEEKTETYIADTSKVKRSLSVSKAEKAMYVFVLENRKRQNCEVDIIFRLFEGKAGERIKEIKPVELSPNDVLKFKFILPEAVFWDDDYYFTGNIESSDMMTKFNDKTGLIWKEEKDY